MMDGSLLPRAEGVPSTDLSYCNEIQISLNMEMNVSRAEMRNPRTLFHLESYTETKTAPIEWREITRGNRLKFSNYPAMQGKYHQMNYKFGL